MGSYNPSSLTRVNKIHLVWTQGGNGEIHQKAFNDRRIYKQGNPSSLPSVRLRLTPRHLRLLGARYARTPVAFGSLRVGYASLPSARLRTLRVACGSLAWPSAKSVGAPPQLPAHVLANPRRRRRLRLPGRPIALSRNPSNSAMSAESDSRSIGIPVFSQPCTEYR